MKPLAPNTLLQNRYLIVHLLGKGEMSEVYLSIDQRLGSSVALKRTLRMDDARLSDQFEKEARTLSRLRHPVLPKVSDHFIENDNQYLVMDHISGDDLANRLTATQKPFPLSWVLFWADQLLDALAYLHTHEPPIIHRDIKPQNLKLTDENNIILLDFGLSTNSAGQSSGSSGSGGGDTPHYAPMEQIRGTGTNPRSDIYSLSATLYQLLTNIVPRDALSRADFLLSGKADPIAPINEINSAIPKTISDVIIKGMSLSQDHRFTDAREMQRVLRETYAKMQSDASEKTIAFNMRDEQPALAPQALPISANDKTEQFSAPVFNNQTASKDMMGAQTIPFGMVGNTAPETPSTASINTDKTAPIQDFDATLRINDAPKVSAPQNFAQKTEVLPVSASELPQSNIKTVVFGGDFGAAEYLANNKAASPQNLAADDYAAKIEETPAAEQNFSSDRTVSLIQFEKQNTGENLGQNQPVSAFDPVPQMENFAATAETRLPTDDYSAVGETYSAPVQDAPLPPVQMQTPPVQPIQEKKKSKGLIFALIGGLFGLAILAFGAGGVAWYLMSQPTDPGATNVATPTPAPSVSATPTPEQTPEQSNTNTSSNTGGSNTNAATTSSPDNSAVNTAPSPDKSKPGITTPTPITQPTRQPDITPRPTPPVTIKTPRVPTPRPTSKPDVKQTPRGTIIPQ